MPTPSGADTFMGGVSCATATSCEAVGSGGVDQYDQTALAEHWNGTAWTIDPTPQSPTSSFSQLQYVTCSSTTSCVAVGDQTLNGDSGQSYPALIERWNGATWSPQPIPDTGNDADELLGVTCPVSSSCTAVGFAYTTSGEPRPLAEHWDGTSWAVQPTPDPRATDYQYGDGSELIGISCPTTSFCFATGDTIHAHTQSAISMSHG